MLAPKNVKYRTPHRSHLKGWASSGTLVAFGDYGIQSLQQAWFTSRQIETSRRILIRYVRRSGKLWIRIFPDKIVTRRPAETRIGSCKGSLRYWVAIIRPGQVLFEFAGLSRHVARQAIRIVSSKLHFKVGLIKKSFN
jgi:large subunit ribosomal protein L16